MSPLDYWPTTLHCNNINNNNRLQYTTDRNTTTDQLDVDQFIDHILDDYSPWWTTTMVSKQITTPSPDRVTKNGFIPLSPWNSNLIDNSGLWTVNNTSTSIFTHHHNNTDFSTTKATIQHDYTPWNKTLSPREKITTTKTTSSTSNVKLTTTPEQTTSRVDGLPTVVIVFTTTVLENNRLCIKSMSDDDDVSELNDNPDIDDDNILPHATIDVLTSLFDEEDYDSNYESESDESSTFS